MTLPVLEEYRQSLLAGMTKCPRRTMHGLTVGDDLAIGWVEHYGDLGTAWHAYQQVYLQTLGEHDAKNMADETQEAIEIMYEVLARLPFVLPFDALDELRGMVLGFCNIPWDPKLLRTADLEVDLRENVTCPDGVTRVLKGTPDVLMFDPPHSLLIVDGKSGRGKPSGPRVEPEVGEVVEERKWLSDLFQGDTYSYLAMRRYPSAKRVTFREYHLRSGQIRQGVMTRAGLEHVERKLADVMMKVDRASREGEGSPLWRPRPGGHCNRQCPVARSCPIPKEMRGDGALETQEDADEAARALAVLEGQRTALIGQLKARAEDPANPLPVVNEETVAAWKPPTGRGRRFGIWKRADVLSSQEEAA